MEIWQEIIKDRERGARGHASGDAHEQLLHRHIPRYAGAVGLDPAEPYRAVLPSEAQWEFAARAGNGATKWGDGSGILNVDKDANLDKLGRYQRNGGQVPNGSSYANPAQSCGATNGTAIVGSYAPNAWGLYDTAGNVWEWCLDWYADDITAHYGKVNIDPATPANTLSGVSGADRVIRGGGWGGAAGSCRPAYRGNFPPSARNNLYNGFRLACTAGLQ